MHTSPVALFVLVDIIVTVAVFRYVLARRDRFGGVLGQLSQLAAVSADVRRETKEYLSANWSGDPASLPSALVPLLAKLESDMASRGVNVDRENLKRMVVHIILNERLARVGDIQEAMKQVA